ncbi:MAG: acyl-CoA desaturase [Chthoniobacterales bacterium]|nr:acyl-CoA desaturase [Chthoniobacterales bacterium]
MAVAILLYLVRMFFVTGIYHRYFCHRSYRVSRPVQFIMALLGLTCMQRGPLWWAAVHRHHHAHSDKEEDIHSPTVRGFLWAHIGWLTSARNYPTDYHLVRDFLKYPEIRFLNRFDLIGTFLLFGFLWVLGEFLQRFFPELNTNPAQMIVWGFFISTTVLFHATCSINSFSHLFGTRRYDTRDSSRNNFLLALITLGEGWHNNHHRYQRSARQGFFWWEIDITYYILWVLSKIGMIHDLRPVPEEAYQEAQTRELAESN